jgi:uncharacterized membrane protein
MKPQMRVAVVMAGCLPRARLPVKAPAPAGRRAPALNDFLNPRAGHSTSRVFERGLIMSRTIALAAFAAVLAATAGSFVVLPSGKTHAADKDATFLIPAAEGYGVADCLTGGGSECGRIVADAYCEAQGFAKAESYGRAAAEDLTGSLDAAAIRPESERPIRITCAN